MKRVKLTVDLWPYGNKGDVIDVSNYNSKWVLKHAELIGDLGPYGKGVKKEAEE